MGYSVEAGRLQRHLKQQLAGIIGVSAEDVDPNKSFSALGLESMRAAEYIRSLNIPEAAKLSPGILWEYPTIEALSLFLSGRRPEEKKKDAAEKTRDINIFEPIAVIGMACRFPDAGNAEEFRNLLLKGLDAVKEHSIKRNYPEDNMDNDYIDTKGTVRRWGKIGSVDEFDAGFFSISPREANQIDPQQRVSLELAVEALVSSGIPVNSLKSTMTGVFMGAMWNEYRQPASCLTPHSATGGDTSIIAARISYSLGLNGPSISLNTACSSSLVAIHAACNSLHLGECSLALAGGINLILLPDSFISLEKLGALSPEGHCKAFDEGGDGYARGEGGAVFVLKRLYEAVSDNDRILGIIRGSAVNNDGFSNGLTSPNGHAQVMVMGQALENAGLQPGDVQYIEAHGTGTPVGDPIEAASIGKVYGEAKDPGECILIGSVKTNIGHLEAASGAAGLFKTILSQRECVIPPTLNFTNWNPEINSGKLRLGVVTKLTPWPCEGKPAIAGISSFGFGGTNCHMVVEGCSTGPTNLFLLSALSPGELKAGLAHLRTQLDETDGNFSSMAGLALSLSRMAANSDKTYRLAVAADSKQELCHKIDSICKSIDGYIASPGMEKRRLAYVFSGNGSQWWGMGRYLLLTEAAFRNEVVRIDNMARKMTGRSLTEDFLAGAQVSRMHEATTGQLALFAFQMGMVKLLEYWGIKADAVIGHSVGEIAAAASAGILTCEDAVRLVILRSRLQSQQEGKGAMALVYLPESSVRPLLSGKFEKIYISGSNSPESTNISGDKFLIRDFMEFCSGESIEAFPIDVGIAYHSPHLENISEELVEKIGLLTPYSSSIPMYSTVTACRLEKDECTSSYWGRNLCRPVRFAEAVQCMIAEGISHFVEISPHTVLLRSIRECIKVAGIKCTALGTMQRNRMDRRMLLESVGRLYEHGYTFREDRLFPHETQPLTPSGPALSFEDDKIELFVISAHGASSLARRTKRFISLMDKGTNFTLKEICTYSLRRENHWGFRMAVTAASMDMLLKRLRLRLEACIENPCVYYGAREAVLLFDDRMELDSNSIKQLFDFSPVFHDTFTELEGIFRKAAVSLPVEIQDEIPSGADLAPVSACRNAVLFMAQVSMGRLLKLMGIRCAWYLGRGVGAIAAEYLANGCGEKDKVAERVLSCKNEEDALNWMQRENKGNWEGNRAVIYVSTCPGLFTGNADGYCCGVADDGEAEGTTTLRERLLAFFGRLYENGFDIAWELVYPDKGNVMPFPSIEWQRASYWLPAEKDTGQTEIFSLRSAPAGRGQGKTVEYYKALAKRKQLGGFIRFGAFPEVVPGFFWLGAWLGGFKNPELQETALAAIEEMRDAAFRGIPFEEINTVLDIGCGYGSDLIWLAKKYSRPTFYGNSISQQQVEAANAAARECGLDSRVAARLMDSTKDDLGGTYDLMLSFQVLHHIKDKCQALSNMTKHMSPEGLCVFAEIVSKISSDIDHSESSAYFSPAGDWARWLSEAGLRVTSCTDASIQVANYLYDPDFETHLSELAGDFGQDEIRHLRGPQSLAGLLKNRLAGYYLIQLRRDTAAGNEELFKINLNMLLNPGTYGGVAEVIAKDKAPERTEPVLSQAEGTDKGAVLQIVLEQVSEILMTDKDKIHPGRPLGEYGLDSVLSLQLRARLESVFHIALPATALYNFPSPMALSLHIAALLSGSLRENAGTGYNAAAAVHKNIYGSNTAKKEPVAVIGIGCRFPGGADSPGTFWRLLSEKRDAVSQVPADRWNINDWHNDGHLEPGRIISRYGGFIRDVWDFDPVFFGISGREAEYMDPQQRLALEVCWEALAHAGIDPGSLKGTNTGIFLGVMGNDAALLHSAYPERLNGHSYAGYSFVANRISYLLDSRGPSLSVDTACSSSLSSVYLACRSLLAGECDIAIAGGVNLMLSPIPSVLYSKWGMLSPDGRCKTFDADANGFARGEGCGIVILKRLDDARRAGDRCLAGVYGFAMNHGGQGSLFNAPNGLAQSELYNNALSSADIAPRRVGFIECHGTGTALGDPIEVEGISRVYGKDKPVVLGAVKSNIGHLEGAAGIAGFIKMCLCIEKRKIPANLHLKRINPHLDAYKDRVAFPGDMLEWEEEKPFGAVSAFGAGGTNVHIVMGEAMYYGLTHGRDSEHPLRPLPVWKRQTYCPAHFMNRLEPAASSGRKNAGFSTFDHPIFKNIFQGAKTVYHGFLYGENAKFAEGHLVGGMQLLPMSGIAEMVLSCLRHREKEESALEEVRIYSPLELPAGDRLEVQLFLDKTPGDTHGFELYARMADSGDWTLVAGGRAIRYRDNGFAKDISPGACEEFEDVPETHDEFYQSAHKAGIDYMGRYSSIRSLKAKENTVLAKVSLEKKEAEHPMFTKIPLLDSAMHGVLAAIPEFRYGQMPFVPVGADGIYVSSREAEEVVSRIIIPENTGLSGEKTIKADITVIEPGKGIWAEVKGLRLRASGKKHEEMPLEGSVNSWIYQPVWKRGKRAAYGKQILESADAYTWIIMGSNENPECCRLTEKLREHDAKTIRVSSAFSSLHPVPERRTLRFEGDEDIEGLFKNIDTKIYPFPWKLVYFYEKEDGTAAPAAPEKLMNGMGLAEPAARLLNIVQHLIRGGYETRCQLYVVTEEGGQDLNDPLNYCTGHSLSGIGKAAALEHPSLWGSFLFLEGHLDKVEPDDLIGEMLLPASEKEEVVSVSGTSRSIMRLERPQKVCNGESRASIRSDASYLITGGFGALGLATAEWLAGKGARHIVLTGRTGQTEEAGERISKLECTGVEIRKLKADISDYFEVQVLINEIKSTLPPLRGVIHAAGVLNDGALENLDSESLRRVFIPKCHGAWNLHLLTAGIRLDFFILYSSIASLFGSAGQGGYAAANTFMDALAHCRVMNGLPALSINWGAWQGGGMMSFLEQHSRDRWEDSGVMSMDKNEALAALDAVLQYNMPQVCIAGISPGRFMEKFAGKYASRLFSDMWRQEAKLESSALDAALSSSPGYGHMKIMQDYIAERIIRIMHLPIKVENYDCKKSFFQYGMDSLLAIELRDDLQSGTGCPLVTSAIFENPDAEKLARYLLGRRRPA